MQSRIGTGVLFALGLAGLLIPVEASVLAAGVARQDDCAKPGQWLDPATGARLESSALLDAMAGKRIVLLGESHTAPEDHRWQTYTLAGLHALQPRVIVGFEMFPRRVQPALDAWSRGELAEEEFLRASEWREVWGYPAEFYLPLLHFARQNRLPTRALNVERSLVSLVGERGWDEVPVAERGGLSDPAPASDAYRRALAEVYAQKQNLVRAHGGGQADAVEVILESADFARFVEAQLTWDRGMAEALALAHRADPQALVVGVVGRGHLEHGYGIPHQLADLGIGEIAVLLPLAADAACDALVEGLAEAVFVVDDLASPAPARPRLGVRIETAEHGVRIDQVMDGSVAAASDLRAGDVIVRAAGTTTRTSGELIEVVQRQAPGTWLPLEVERDGRRFEAVARFPSVFTP